MLLIFAGCIAFMGATVIVKNQEVQIREKKDELATLKSQNAILEAELAEQVDLEYIKQEAINRLGMAEPQPYQIVYIDVPKDSYTIQYAADEVVEEEPSFIASILNLFKKSSGDMSR
ncbi:FtsB family cell division protein [Anaerotignum lactatifermentans]